MLDTSAQTYDRWEMLSLTNQDLATLLHYPPQQFWAYVLHDTSIKRFLDSYLWYVQQQPAAAAGGSAASGLFGATQKGKKKEKKNAVRMTAGEMGGNRGMRACFEFTLGFDVWWWQEDKSAEGEESGADEGEGEGEGEESDGEAEDSFSADQMHELRAVQQQLSRRVFLVLLRMSTRFAAVDAKGEGTGAEVMSAAVHGQLIYDYW